MNSFRNWAANWGDIASVVGLLLTVLGFVVSIVSILRTKSVAEGVRSAVGQVSKQLAQKGAISDLASAISTMDELKRLQRSSAWAALPDRYSELRANWFRSSLPDYL